MIARVPSPLSLARDCMPSMRMQDACHLRFCGSSFNALLAPAGRVCRPPYCMVVWRCDRHRAVSRLHLDCGNCVPPHRHDSRVVFGRRQNVALLLALGLSSRESSAASVSASFREACAFPVPARARQQDGVRKALLSMCEFPCAARPSRSVGGMQRVHATAAKGRPGAVGCLGRSASRARPRVRIDCSIGRRSSAQPPSCRPWRRGRSWC